MSEPRFAALAAEIAAELGELEALGPELARVRARLDDADSLDLRSAGSILHDFYCGVERIFERIATELDGGAPGGADWHVSLLRRMAVPVETVRPAAISAETAKQLDDYLRFRHLFRNVYGRQLHWERMRPLVDGQPATGERAFHELRRFAGWLRELAART